jgi:Zn-finger nucleic acid-binding protein
MVVIDRCPECGGVWLDGGELERLYTDASDEALVQMARAIWV